MLHYILRRLALMVPTLLGMTAVVFFVMALSPGGIGGPKLSEEGGMRPELRKAMEESLAKLYGPPNEPLVFKYCRWLNNVSPVGFWLDAPAVRTGLGVPIGRDGDSVRRLGFKTPNLGESAMRRRPVTDLYKEALPITLLLNILTTPIIYTVAILTGLFAARHRGKRFDTVTGTGFLTLWSIPEIWTGVMLIGLLASDQYIRLFPAAGLHDTLAGQMPFFPRFAGGFQRGWLLDMLWHLALPLVVLSYGGFAVLSKLTRGSVLDNLSADYVRTARAKGVSDRDVLFRHVFRNSLLPLITVASSLIPSLLVGSLIVENMFSIQGMGKLSVEAVKARDRDLVMAGALVGGVLVLVFDLIRDVCYAIADPRVSYE